MSFLPGPTAVAVIRLRRQRGEKMPGLAVSFRMQTVCGGAPLEPFAEAAAHTVRIRFTGALEIATNAGRAQTTIREPLTTR